MAHTGKRRRRNQIRTPWSYVVVVGVIAGAILIAVALWTSSQARSGAIALGAAAPSFALPATTGGELALSQLRGSKVVVYFYEGANCGPCQAQLVELQSALPVIGSLGASVVAATVDPLLLSESVAVQLHLGFPILEDTNHVLGSAFGVFRMPSGMDMGPVDDHSMFIIDAAGRVRWKWLALETMHVPMAAVLTALREQVR